MNPSYKSDKPGIAPGCGMPLEPVYADETDSERKDANLLKSMPAGTIRIPAERQQLIGVKEMVVEKAPWTHAVRVLGRVTADENRIYRINAAINGWIEDVQKVTTGSIVKKNELLATFYSLDYRTAVQVYLNLIRAGKRADQGTKGEEKTPGLSPTQLKPMRDIVREAGRRDLLRDVTRDLNFSSDAAQKYYYRKSLLNFGIPEYQIEEMEKGGNLADDIEIRSPIQGFILSRNVSPGLRFDRGAEFFRIADLSRVWVLADLFENEASLYQPGRRVKMELPYRNKTLSAQISNVLPQFDPATRTLKLRLEADNPDFILRPDMFVNVEISISGPPAIIVPADAVFDSGLKKTIFVDRGNGFFEPRQVETGRFLGERVEIVQGIMAGEKIVISGNFLIDAEARLQMASSGITGKIGHDPVCGMNIDEDRSRAEGNFLEYRGKTYFFCDLANREAFRKDPERYLKSSGTPGIMGLSPSSEKARKPELSEPVALSKGREVKKGVRSVNGMNRTNPPYPETISTPKGAAPMADQKPGTGVMPSSMSDNPPEPKNIMIPPTTAGPSPGCLSPASPVPGAKEGGQRPPMPTVPSETKSTSGVPPSMKITPPPQEGGMFPSGPPPQPITEGGPAPSMNVTPPPQGGGMFPSAPTPQPKAEEMAPPALGNPPVPKQFEKYRQMLERRRKPITTPEGEGDHD
jgi:membrane fusion protein, copper/silver efflux system